MVLALNFMKFDGHIIFPVPNNIQNAQAKMLYQLEKQLRRERAKNISRKGHIMTFSGRIFRFRVLARFLDAADAGFFRVKANGPHLFVDYRLSFLAIFLYIFTISIIFSLILAGLDLNFQGMIFIYGVIWLFGLGGNIVFPLVSIRLFVHKVFSDVIEKTSVWTYLYWLS